MFKELLPLLRKGDTIGLSIGMEGENQYRVNVMPKLFTLDGDKGADRKVLNTPLTITGTAEELDSPAFAETLTRFTTSATGCRQTLEDVEAAHKTAADAAKARPAPKAPATPKPAARPAAKPVAKAPVKKAGANKSSWKDRTKPKAGAPKPAPAAPAAAPVADPASEELDAANAAEQVAEELAVTQSPPTSAKDATPALI